jgi:hypothetical protein
MQNIYFAFVIISVLSKIYDKHALYLQRRKNDEYLLNVCNSLDFKRLGEHSKICIDVERKLSMIKPFFVIQNLLNDAYNMSIFEAFQLVLFYFCIYIVTIGFKLLSNRFRKIELPQYNHHIKNE